MARTATITRQTKETSIKLKLDLDNYREANILTPIPFVTHMLETFSKHSLFYMDILAEGEDLHHLLEDIGIVIGEGMYKALGDKVGIRRYGSISLVMDEVLVNVAVDISGRSFLVYNVSFNSLVVEDKFDKNKQRQINVEIIKEFFAALVRAAKITLHINLLYGENSHHIIEAIFKGVGIVLSNATKLQEERKHILPSTKNRLD